MDKDILDYFEHRCEEHDKPNQDGIRILWTTKRDHVLVGYTTVWGYDKVACFEKEDRTHPKWCSTV